MAGLAITLGGGGARGDFEVGALHFLYEHGLRPDFLCTTSVGSVNGLKLAEGEGADPHPVTWGPQHLDVFWRAADGALWHRWYDGGWHGPESLGAALPSEPQAAAVGTRQVEVVWRGADGAPWHKRFDGAWQADASLESRPLGGALAAVPTKGGGLDVFWRGTDGALWHAQHDGSRWHEPESLGGGPLGSDPRAVSWGPARVDVFWRGTDGALWHKWYDGKWHAHESLGAGPLGSGPQVVSWSRDRLDVFWRGADNALWHKWYDGQWHDHESLGAGPLGSDPHVVSWGPGRLDVFWRGQDGALWHKWYDGSWQNHESLGARPLGSDPHPFSLGPQHIDVFWRGTDAALWHKWYDGAWHPHESLGSGPLHSDPQPVAFGPQHIDVLWRGSDGTLTHKRFDGRWHDPESLGGGLLGSEPTAISSGRPRIDVLWRALDGGPWHRRFDAPGWHPEEPLETRPLGSPINVVSRGGGRLDLFWRGTDRALWHQRFDGTRWHAPESLGAGPLGSEPHGVGTRHGGLDVFWRGTDGALWHKSYDGAAWHTHESLAAGPLASDPQVVSWGQSRVDVFWRGRDGALWHKRYDGQWHDHESLGSGPLGSDPRAVAWGPNRLDVFWRGMDGGLWHEWYDGQWHPQERLVTGPIGSDPHAVAWGPNRLDVFWRGGGGALWHLWYDGRWHPPESHGAAAPMPVHGLRGLTEIWLSLQAYTDFFAEEAWLSSPSPAMQRIRRLLVDFVATNSDEVERQLATTPTLVELLNRERTAIAAREGATGLSEDLLNLLPLLPRPAQPVLSAAAFMEFLGLSAFHVDAFSAAKDAPSMFNLGPVAARSAGSMDRARVAGWGATGRKLRIAAVSVESGELRYVTENGGLVGRTFAPLTREQPSTACAQLDEYVDFLEGELKIARAEKEAKKELAENIEKDLEKARKDLADCKARSPSRRVPVTVDVLSGMIASASMPAFFPPVPLAGESYVDGGLRAMIPVEAAIRLGADTVIAVTASKSSVDPWHGSKTAPTVALRSLMDIAINEIAFRDVHAPLGFGKAAVTVIEPRVDTHTTFTIYPAFVRNRMAYGYMCAADAIAPPPDPEDAAKARAAADRIHVLRYLAARLECWLVGEPVPPAMVKLALGDMTGAAVELARIKAEIKSLVAERTKLGAKVPSGTGEWDDPDLWSSRTEIHPWDPFRTAAAPPAKVAVPKVVDDPVGVAETAIRSAGLVPKRMGSTADDTLVLSQDPKAGTLVDVRSTVELTLIEIL